MLVELKRSARKVGEALERIKASQLQPETMKLAYNRRLGWDVLDNCVLYCCWGMTIYFFILRLS